MRIAENVEMLEVKVPRGENIAVIYPTLTWDDENLVLFDAGYPGAAEYVVAAVKEAGFDISNLTALILTHQDIDHIGGAREILALAPNARVYAHAVDLPYIEGTQTPTKLAGLEALKVAGEDLGEREGFYQMLKNGFATAHLPVDQALADGDVLDMCGGIETVFTPGHTPGHTSFYLRASKVLVCADAANVVDGHLVGSNPTMTWDTEKATDSLAKLESFDFTAAISYHTGLLQR